jgi:methyl-accepting chemotaxis protein
MRHLTVYNRFAIIIAVLTVAFVAALAAQVVVLRDTVIEERRTKVFDLVEAAKKILATYEEKAKAGKLSEEQARQLAFDAIGAMRWGKSADYLGIYGAGSTNAGVTYVHANPKYINVDRWDYKDNKGQLLIQNIVGKARTGGGFLEYQVPKATVDPSCRSSLMPAGMVRARSCSQSRRASIRTISTRWFSTELSGSPRADWRGC